MTLSARKTVRRPRLFGRQYVIRWNGATSEYDVTLGHEGIGSHQDHSGAMALVAWHCRQETLPQVSAPAVITVAADGGSSIARVGD